MRLSQNSSLPLFLLLAGVLLILTAPTLFTKSMFMDGTYYASIARNLAEGIGSLWHPEFTKTHLTTFHEHPPLALWLQGSFFHILGNGFWVERIYSLLTYFLAGWIMVNVWKRSVGQYFPALGWLPLLFGLCIPIIWWGASNNVLENTMILFLLLGVLFFIKSLERNGYLNLSLGGAMIFLGSLCKGPVALFPLAFFFWAFFALRSVSFSRIVLSTFLALCSVLLPLAVILIASDPAYTALKDYLLNQVIQGVSERETVNSRFYIVDRLFDQLIPSLILIAVMVPFMKWKVGMSSVPKGKSWRWSFLFFAVGLSGVLPMMISKTQGGFYMIPALPFFCLGFASFLAPFLYGYWLKVRRGKASMILWLLAAFFLVAGISLQSYFFGRTGEDEEKIRLVYKVDRLTDKNYISIDPSLKGDYGLHAYFQRYARISLVASNKELHKVFVLPKDNDLKAEIPDNYKKLPLKNKKYVLYCRRGGNGG